MVDSDGGIPRVNRSIGMEGAVWNGIQFGWGEAAVSRAHDNWRSRYGECHAIPEAMSAIEATNFRRDEN